MRNPGDIARWVLAVSIGLWLVGPLGPTDARAQQSDGADGQIWVEPEESTPAAAETPLTSSTISTVAEEASPAVVNIIVAYKGSQLASVFEGEDSPSSPDGGIGQGSGFLIHPDGYVLTNYHVIEGAKEIRVRTQDQSEYRAGVVGVDPKTDVALMRLKSDRTFPALPLGDSDQLDVGDYVIAIGNPLGLNHTVTSGIVSALGRRNLGLEEEGLYTDFIQIDVSINPGNSGGPLVGLSGQVVGINTAINRKGQGIGFTIPINMVKTLLPQLQSKGYVTRSWLGARVQEVTPALARSFQMDRPRGALITEVVEESPAAKGGLNPGDVIVEFDGRTVRTSDQLPWMVASAGPDRTVRLTLVRNGDRTATSIDLAEHPEQNRPDLPQTDKQARKASRDLKVTVKNLTEALARQLGAGSKSGVVVTEVGEESPAKGAGLRKRDVITEIDAEAIDSKDDFETALRTLEAGEVVRLKLVRGGRVVYIAFER